MVRADVINLISITYESDSIGNQRAIETVTSVYCEAKSVSQSEFFKAGSAGLKPAYKFTMFRYDYNGQQEVEYNGQRFEIYRTYAGESDDIELYVQEKVGMT